MANEFYRQSIHLVCGLTAAFSTLLLERETFLIVWGAVFLVAFLTVVFTPVPLRWLWDLFERSDVAFRGKGGLFFLAGIWLTGALFWDVAFGALLLLAVPDALATMLAPFYRGPRLPWNRRKSFMGSGVFLVSAFPLLLFFMPFTGSALVAFLLTAIESFDYREVPFLDDNLVIPLVAAFLLGFV